MSDATPMDPDIRKVFYTMQNGVLPRLPFPGDEDSPAYRLTPRQRRRALHKEHRGLRKHISPDSRTPARGDAISQGRARRKAKELIRTARR
jgi:hypothetical protein